MVTQTTRFSTPGTGVNTPEGGDSPVTSPRKRPRTTSRSRDWDTELAASSSSSRREHKDKLGGNRDPMKAKDTGPDASFISPSVASVTVRRFVAAYVAKEGFERAESPALHRFELEVISCEYSSFELQRLLSNANAHNLFVKCLRIRSHCAVVSDDNRRSASFLL